MHTLNFCYITVPQWFSHMQMGRMLTVRDLLSWVDFINVTESRLGPEYAVLHGMFLVLLDGLSLGNCVFSFLAMCDLVVCSCIWRLPLTKTRCQKIIGI